MKSGAVEFVEKPFNRQTLLDKVQRAIRDDVERRVRLAASESILAKFRRLTGKEREVLDLIKNGRPNKEIATRLEITPRASSCGDRVNAQARCGQPRRAPTPNDCSRGLPQGTSRTASALPARPPRAKAFLRFLPSFPRGVCTSLQQSCLMSVRAVSCAPPAYPSVLRQLLVELPKSASSCRSVSAAAGKLNPVLAQPLLSAVRSIAARCCLPAIGGDLPRIFRSQPGD